MAGDLAYGPRIVIDAVASGKKAALKIHEYISKKHLALKAEEIHLQNYGSDVLNNEVPHPKDYEKIKRISVPAFSADERLKSVFTPVETGFTKDLAQEQAGRCLNCAVNTIFNGDRCILCGGCSDVCPEYCLRLVSLENIRGDEPSQPFTKTDTGQRPEGAGAAIIKDEDRCIRCGLCAKRCPVDAITMERFLFKEVWASE